MTTNRCRRIASATSHMQGDNVTRGYFENPEANAAAFTADGWLRTGDLGLFHDGELYISGRAKEIIFVNGQNYYPHDLEAIAQRVRGTRAGQGRGRGRAAARLADRAIGGVCAPPRWHGGVPAHRHPGGAAHQRADRARSRRRGAGQAHPEDHQRQDSTSPAGGKLSRRRV